VLQEEKGKVQVAPVKSFPDFLVFLLSVALLIYIVPPVVKTVKSVLCCIGCTVLYAARLLKTVCSSVYSAVRNGPVV
jgi:glucan phosphoethanolaminetransferase (alkaline phosphatase superfamily)